MPAELEAHERGATAYFASQADQRFGYYLYVPKAFSFERASNFRLCVLVHGTGRTPGVYRDLMADFAEANDVLLMAPLFPVGIVEPGELDGYKYIERNGVRYDELLLAMIDEVAHRYDIRPDRFLAFGYSGGGHFVHRFFYLHPKRLLGLSVGAPGVVTLIDRSLPWWRGIADIEQKFGRSLDLASMRQVPVQMVVGLNDTDPAYITIQPGERSWMEGANDAGRTRIDRIKTLAASFEAHGISVQLDLLPGIRHESHKVFPSVQAFFTDVLHDGGNRAGVAGAGA